MVDRLDIDYIIKQYKGGSTTSFYLSMMIKVLFYADTTNGYSYRKIENVLPENIHFMRLTGYSARLYLSLDVQYIDGTKIESATTRYTFVWKGSVEKSKQSWRPKLTLYLMK